MKPTLPPVSSSHSRDAASPHIAYLLSRYPARSHTFFLNEILGLRLRGLGIEVASINAPDRPLEELSMQEAAEARTTFYVKGTGRLRAGLALLGTVCLQPAVLIRGVRFIAKLPLPSLRQRLFWLFYLAEAILVGRWMQRRKLTHLHVHFGGAVASVGLLTSIAWRIPYSLTIHGPEELIDPTAYQMPAKLAQAGFVLCISDFCRNQLRALAPQSDWSKFTVIRLGVDPLQLSPQPCEQPVTHTPATVVCVGRMVPEKGHRILLQTLAALRARGTPFRAELIGTGPLETELRRCSVELGLADSVVFTSGLSHAETLAHVRSADIFALASFAEGVPVALMEAMSLGVPCVSTTVAGIPELIHSGESGLLVAPGHVEAFTEALAHLLADESLRQRLATEARRRIVAEYNLPHNLDRLADFFVHQLSEPLTTAQPIAAAYGTHG